jgi:ABC-type antimicrobial peptide transport system permease subunit
MLRTREVGVRKVSGAKRKDLIYQFMGETVLLAGLALIVATLLIELLLPAFNSLSGKNLSYSVITGGKTILSTLIVVLCTGVIAGSYPAFYLSSLKPVQTLNTSYDIKSGRKGSLRKILVVVQFTFTIILIFCTVVFYRQLYYIQNKDLGFDKDNVIYFASYGQYGRSYESSKNELLQNPDIISVCRGFPPGRGYRGTSDVNWPGKDPTNNTNFFTEFVDHDYLKTFNMKMIHGRFYSVDHSTDTSNYVINETAARAMGLDDPVGMQFTHNNETGIIIGVVGDFNGGPLHYPIRPKVMKFDYESLFFVCIRHRAGKTAAVIDFLDEKWQKFVPGRPFRYNLLSQSIENYYKSERRVSSLIQYFTVLAVFIACLGLYGLSAFLAERKTKEIGIRKVLGAKISGIIILFSGEFSKWVVISSLIAWPVAWVLMREWLDRFTYKVDLDIWTYIISAMFAVVIAVITVSYQSLKAALANPVEALRYE